MGIMFMPYRAFVRELLMPLAMSNGPTIAVSPRNARAETAAKNLHGGFTLVTV